MSKKKSKTRKPEQAAAKGGGKKRRKRSASIEEEEEEEEEEITRRRAADEGGEQQEDSSEQELEQEQEDEREEEISSEEKEEEEEEGGDARAADIRSDDEKEEGEGEEEEQGREAAAPAPAPAPTTTTMTSDGRYHNKQRCLILCSRGVTARYRHLLEDLRTLVPHHKKESKLDAGKNDAGGVAAAVNDIAEVRGCNAVLFLECRKRRDAYLWVGRTGSSGGGGGPSPTSSSASPSAAVGPSVKFEVTNVHTMDELRLTGNCMRGSRPVLTFDASFDGRVPHLKLVKELFVDVFGTPRGHPKSKPFVDRVMGFYYVDGKIWVRNYQILEQQPANAKEAHRERRATGSDGRSSASLVEIGPRFVLNPIRIFRGSFGGQTLYRNEDYVNPNAIRATAMREKGRKYDVRKGAERMRKKRREGMVVPEDPLGDVFR